MCDKQTIIAFINEFTRHGTLPQVVDSFINGNCYWFAHILSVRFNGEIVYNHTGGHFACLIDGSYYDITGELCVNKKDWVSWDKWDFGDEKMSSARRKIIGDCILKDHSKSPDITAYLDFHKS